MSETKRCPMCGEEILSVAKKCKHCGEYLAAESVKTASKKNIVIGAIAVLVILVVAVLGCFSLSSSGSRALPAVIIFSALVGISLTVFVISKICDIARNTSKK